MNQDANLTRPCICRRTSDGEASGRIFGGWAMCIHGAKGRLAEVEDEAEQLRDFIRDAEADAQLEPEHG